MDADKYQQLSKRTLIDKPTEPFAFQIIICSLSVIGIAGEAGEINDLVKKGIFHQHGLDVAEVAEEIGDLMWYVAALCTKLELNLSNILKYNVAKLEKRYPDGFSSEDSRNRK
jgi:NTP pyrophosphatase (non-canonical NTP hydrolase)